MVLCCLSDFVCNGIFVYTVRICYGTEFIVINSNFHVFFKMTGSINLDNFGHVSSLAIGDYARFYILDVVAGSHSDHWHALWRGFLFVTIWSISWFRFSKLCLFGSVSLWCGNKWIFSSSLLMAFRCLVQARQKASVSLS